VIFDGRHHDYEMKSRCYAFGTQTLRKQPLQKYGTKTRFDLQKDLMHAGVLISSNTMCRLLEAGKKAKKPLKSNLTLR